MTKPSEEDITDQALEAVQGTEKMCQICLTNAPEWELPISSSAHATQDKLAREANATPLHDDTYPVCTNCLTLVEERNHELIARTSLNAITRLRKPALAGMKPLQRKQLEIRTYMTLKQATTDLLNGITGDPVRISK